MFTKKRRTPAHAAVQIIVCAVILTILAIVCRYTFLRNYVDIVELSQNRKTEGRWSLDELRIEIRDEETKELMPQLLGEPYIKGRYLYVPINPDRPGNYSLVVYDSDQNALRHIFLRIDRFGTVVNEGSNSFTGDHAFVAAITLFWLAVTAIMVWHFLQAKGPAFYSYSTIFYAGFSLFSLTSFIIMLNATIRHAMTPWEFGMYSVYSTMNSASSLFLFYSSPLVLVFSISMVISNIELLRHERFRVQNILGILIAVLMLAGNLILLILTMRPFSGSVLELRLRNTMDSVMSTVYVYFECMLIGAIICGYAATRYRPEPDKDFILILGCRFRKDGSLTPLLKGRADAALAFWKEQKEQTGKEAIFIPSGGQGSDETMPEAEAIRRYLRSEGIPESLIMPEDRSVNTYQNMQFSRKIIEEVKQDARTVYATTNYHVFRSGVWASLAGLPAEGIGGKTKWWFWPNAFMRECIGLLRNRIVTELILLLLAMAYFTALSMLLPL